MKTVNPFFINTNICYGTEDVATVRKFSENISGNTGNSYIAYAMIRLIFGSFVCPDEIKNIYTYDFNRSEADIEQVNAENSHVIFILQDQIRIEESYGLELPFEKIIYFLKKIKKPIIVVSLGANSFTGYDASFYRQLSPRRVRFFQELSELVPSMGVRGGFTVEVLKQLGINNAEAVGCPSFFEEGRGRKVHKKNSMEGFRLALGGTIYKTNIPDPFYILQDEMELIETFYFSSRDFTEFPYEIDLKAAIEGRYRAFSSIEDWKDFLRPFHFLFGTRVHGAIAALNAGVPSLIVNSDSRAREMSELFNIPYQPELMGQENLDIWEVYDRLDYGEMNRRYDFLYDAYILWLKKNGLELSKNPISALKQPSLCLNSRDYILNRFWTLDKQKLNQLHRHVSELDTQVGELCQREEMLEKRMLNLEQSSIEGMGIKGILKILANKIIKKI